jgi:hypothetical protein
MKLALALAAFVGAAAYVAFKLAAPFGRARRAARRHPAARDEAG